MVQVVALRGARIFPPETAAALRFIRERADQPTQVQDVLEAVAAHSLSRPVTHGARVVRPDVTDGLPLFVGSDAEGEAW